MKRRFRRVDNRKKIESVKKTERYDRLRKSKEFIKKVLDKDNK